MPYLNIETLDDTPQFDACPAFNGGMVSYTRPHLLEEFQAAELKNIDIQQNGVAVTRRGAEDLGAGAVVAGKPVQGIAYFDTPALERLVICIDSGLRSFDGSVWSASPIGSYATADDDAPVCMVQGTDRLWITDGVSPVHHWDGTTLVNAGTGTSTQPPLCKYLIWHTNRLIAAGVPSEPDAVYVSDLLDGATWDAATQQFEIGAGEGDPITGITSWLDFNIAVFKRGSTWVVAADPGAQVGDWGVKLVHRRIGCVSHRSIAQVGQDIWFLSDTGVRSLQRDAATSDQQSITPALSYPIQDIIERINWSRADRACAVFWNSRYLLAVPVDGASHPNYVLVFNTLTESWSGYWTGWSPTQFAVSAFLGQARLVFGQADGLVRQWLDYVPANSTTFLGYTDSGNVPIESKITTRALSFAEPLNPKTGYWMEVEFFESEATIDLSAVRDQGESDGIATGVASAFSNVTLPVDLPFDLAIVGTARRRYDLLQFGRFREIQFVLRSGSGKLSVRGVVAGAFIETLQTEDAV